jgi:hypothetical protein
MHNHLVSGFEGQNCLELRVLCRLVGVSRMGGRSVVDRMVGMVNRGTLLRMRCEVLVLTVSELYVKF